MSFAFIQFSAGFENEHSRINHTERSGTSRVSIMHLRWPLLSVQTCVRHRFELTPKRRRHDAPPADTRLCGRRREKTCEYGVRKRSITPARTPLTALLSDTPLRRPQVKLTALADSQHGCVDHASLGMINASLARAVIPDAAFVVRVAPATQLPHKPPPSARALAAAPQCFFDPHLPGAIDALARGRAGCRTLTWP